MSYRKKINYENYDIHIDTMEYDWILFKNKSGDLILFIPYHSVEMDLKKIPYQFEVIERDRVGVWVLIPKENHKDFGEFIK